MCIYIYIYIHLYIYIYTTCWRTPICLHFSWSSMEFTWGDWCFTCHLHGEIKFGSNELASGLASQGSESTPPHKFDFSLKIK